MARKKEAPEPENHERWLVTYADLITLLMVFFVVMYSMSKVDANKFQAMADALSVSLGGGGASGLDIGISPQGPSVVEQGGAEKQQDTSENEGNDKDNDNQSGQDQAKQEQTSIENLKAKLDAYAQDNAINTQLISDVEERGLVISIQETLLFESGSDTLGQQADTLLRQISTILSTSPNYIRVEGHTDNVPISSGRFPSNWELSSLRACTVIHLLGNTGVDVKRLSSVGYGDTRPITSNETETGRTRNRRVDLIILRSSYDLVESGGKIQEDTEPGTDSTVIDLTEQMNR